MLLLCQTGASPPLVPVEVQGADLDRAPRGPHLRPARHPSQRPEGSNQLQLHQEAAGGHPSPA